MDLDSAIADVVDDIKARRREEASLMIGRAMLETSKAIERSIDRRIKEKQ